jgi:hypothetical protein
MSEEMTNADLGRSGVMVSRIGLGTPRWWNDWTGFGRGRGEAPQAYAW